MSDSGLVWFDRLLPDYDAEMMKVRKQVFDLTMKQIAREKAEKVRARWRRAVALSRKRNR